MFFAYIIIILKFHSLLRIGGVLSKFFLLLFISICFPQNYSLYFDGVDDYVEINNSSNLLENNFHTIEVWLKHDELATHSQDIVSKDGEGFDRQWLLEIQPNQYIQSAIWQDNDYSMTTTESNLINIDDLYHIVQLWDGNQLKIFVQHSPIVGHDLELVVIKVQQ